MADAPRPENPNGAEYWNGPGGEKWVANIEITERLLGSLNAHLLRAAAPRHGESVLDVGCGGGRTTLQLAAAVGSLGRALGVDISEPILQVALSRTPDVENAAFQLGDAATLPLPAAEFDLVCSRFGVMFFDDAVAAFQNLHRCLKPGGRLVFLSWQAMDRNPWMAEPAAAAYAIVPPPEPPDPEAPGPFAFADPDKVRSILTQAGFREPSIDAVPTQMTWDSVDEAHHFLTEMGMVGRLLQDQPEAKKTAVHAAMRGVLERHKVASGVRMDAAAWLVAARA